MARAIAATLGFPHYLTLYTPAVMASLYTGADVLPFGKGQFAVPLGQLWA